MSMIYGPEGIGSLVQGERVQVLVRPYGSRGRGRWRSGKVASEARRQNSDGLTMRVNLDRRLNPFAARLWIEVSQDTDGTILPFIRREGGGLRGLLRRGISKF